MNSFYLLQPAKLREKYKFHLKGLAQMTPLFSSGKVPFIHYRMLENVFCNVFGAKNVGREDISFDAIKSDYGIAIKTFLRQGNSKYEKIAEFNDTSKYPLSRNDNLKLVKEVSEYRNYRLKADIDKYGIESCIYHYVTRDIGSMDIHESPIDFIRIDDILLEKQIRSHIIKFNDRLNSYHFHTTKNTLYKSFNLKEKLDEINVTREVDHHLLMEFLKEVFSANENLLSKYEYVILPLFSTKTGDVPTRSGLNQWNAGGRTRKLDEVYIPIPSVIHKKFPNFFPPRHKKFKLETTDGRVFIASVCQENGKALMSNPNTELGNWILRQKLNIPEGKLVTYDDLQKNNSDTVIVYKIDNEKYKIDLHSIGSYRY